MVRRLLVFTVLLSITVCTPLACGSGSGTAAKVETVMASPILYESAELWGRLENLSGSQNVEVWFWVESDDGSYKGNTIKQTLTAPGDFSYNVMGLEMGTKYWYTAYAQGVGAELGSGDRLSFTTVPYGGL